MRSDLLTEIEAIFRKRAGKALQRSRGSGLRGPYPSAPHVRAIPAKTDRTMTGCLAAGLGELSSGRLRVGASSPRARRAGHEAWLLDLHYPTQRTADRNMSYLAAY